MQVIRHVRLDYDEVCEEEKFGEAPYFVLCDHASNAIPDEFNDLGLTGEHLESHIAWDIGAASLTRALAARLNAHAYLSKFSRLVIDPNRSTEALDLLPEQSDGVQIPGNTAVSYIWRSARVNRFHHPYHLRLDELLTEMQRVHDNPFIISVHSFAPILESCTEERPWHVGLLWRHDEPTARAFMDVMSSTDYCIGDNQPYDANIYNYTMDRHLAPRKLRHLALEIRQDLLETPEQIEEMAECLAAKIVEIS